MRYFKIILKDKHPRIKAMLATYIKTSNDKSAAWVADYVKRTGNFGACNVFKVDEVTEEEALKNE